MDSAVFGFDLGKVVFRIDLSRPDAFGMIENLLKQFFAQAGTGCEARANGILVQRFGGGQQHAPKRRKMNGAQGFAQCLSQNKRHGFQGFRLRHRIFHQRFAEGCAVGKGRLIKAFGNRRDQSQFVGKPQMNFTEFQRLSLRFENGTPHLEVDSGIGHREKRAVPGFVAGARRQDIMGKSGGFRHGDFSGHQKVQALKCLFVRRRVRIRAQRVGLGNDHGSQPFGMIRQNFFRHDIGRKGTADRKGIGGHGAPDFGISFIRMRPDGHQVAVDHIAPGRTEPAADRLENHDQVGIQSAVASHKKAQIVAQRRFARRVKAGDFTDLLEVQRAGLYGGASVEVFETGFHRIEARRMVGQIRLVFPAFLQNQGNHGFEQQGVRAGADGQMDVGEFCRFGFTRIDHDQHFVFVFGQTLKLARGLRNLMALHAVPAEYQKNIGVIDIRLIMQVLLAVRSPANPEGAGKFLRQRAVLVLRAQAPHQTHAESRFKMTALSAAAHVGKRAGAVFVNDALELRCDFIDGLVPGDPLEFVPDFFERIFQAVGVVLVIGDVQTLAADIPFAFGVGFVASNFDDAVVFHFDFQTAVLRAEDTAGFKYFSHV